MYDKIVDDLFHFLEWFYSMIFFDLLSIGKKNVFQIVVEEGLKLHDEE